MQDVNRSGRNYQKSRIEPSRNNPNLPRQQRRPASHSESAASPVAIDQTEDSSSVLFARSGIQNKIIRRLKRGELLPHRNRHELDLHGARSWQVAELLEDFISESIYHDQSCVLVIHGKGFRSESHQGVVKPRTVEWLKNAPDVLAFSSAQPRDGGTGAVYTLLKRRRTD